MHDLATSYSAHVSDWQVVALHVKLGVWSPVGRDFSVDLFRCTMVFYLWAGQLE
jgi:hypothetical protein